MNSGTPAPITLPFKSVAGALVFSLLLGPLGLLYASFWGGIIMLPIGFLVISNKFPYPIAIYWFLCCVWSVGAVNAYNKKIIKSLKS